MTVARDSCWYIGYRDTRRLLNLDNAGGSSAVAGGTLYGWQIQRRRFCRLNRSFTAEDENEE